MYFKILFEVCHSVGPERQRPTPTTHPQPRLLPWRRTFAGCLHFHLNVPSISAMPPVDVGCSSLYATDRPPLAFMFIDSGADNITPEHDKTPSRQDIHHRPLDIHLSDVRLPAARCPLPAHVRTTSA